MTAFISLTASFFLFIWLTRFIVKKETTDVQAIWATALCLILMAWINMASEAGRP